MSLEVDIEKRLGSFSLKTAFTCEGELSALLGASGCGKSMTLRCIAGIVKPDKGRIVLNGRVLFDSEKNINLPPQKRKVGYLFQNYALFQNMTVEQNIACGIHEEKNKAVRAQAIADMIEKMQLSGLEKRKPFQLSGGQQQRTALARILVGKPEILLLDEPFSALDSHLRDQLLSEVKRLLKSFGQDVLMVTHSRDEAYTMCSKLMIMDYGRLCRVGSTKEVFADPQTVPAAIITGCKNIYQARKLSKTAVEVPELGIILETGREVGDDVKAIGIRAHYFNSKTTQNRFEVVFDEEVEAPFEWTVKFRYKGQKQESQSVWWRLGKDKKLQQFPEYLGIAPSNVLLFYDS